MDDFLSNMNSENIQQNFVLNKMANIVIYFGLRINIKKHYSSHSC